MTTIEKHAPYATLINVFTVEPEQAAKLARVLDDATETVMRHVPGFISANIHVSTDGTRVVNYAQWETAEAMEAMLADPTHGACRGAGVELRPAPLHGGISARTLIRREICGVWAAASAEKAPQITRSWVTRRR